MHELARTATDALADRYPDFAPDLPPAFGPCTPATAAQKRAVARAEAAGASNVPPVHVRECRELTVLDLQRDGNGNHGVSLIVAFDAAGNTQTIATHRGTSTNFWTEGVDETRVHTIATADLDGDGRPDVVFALDHHEGSSSSSQFDLSAWLSGPRRTVALGTTGNDVFVAPTQTRDSSHPLVLEIVNPTPTGPPEHYRCVDLRRGLTSCPAAAVVRAVVAAIADGRELANNPFPDRDELDAELAALGVVPANRAALIAAAPATLPEVTAQRLVTRALDREDRWQYRAPAPTRRTELADALGNTPCSALAPAAVEAARTTIATWLSTHEHIVELPACKPPSGTGGCTWTKRAEPRIVASCDGGRVTYVVARWTYTDSQRVCPVAQLARGGLFAITGGTPTRLAVADELGAREGCNQCEFGPPGMPLETQLYRHNATAIAVGLARDREHVRSTVTVAVDGVAHTIAIATEARFYALGAVAHGDPFEIDSEVVSGSIISQWDVVANRWHPIIAFDGTEPAMRDRPAADASRAAAWLWHERQLADARKLLATNDWNVWAADAENRADVDAALVLIGADPSLRAAVTAAAAAAGQ